MLTKVKKHLQNKQNKRVNKLAENVRAGKPITAASLKNLITLVRKYQQANYGPYYYYNENDKLKNGQGRKLTKKVVLGNINNMKKYNMFVLM